MERGSVQQHVERAMERRDMILNALAQEVRTVLDGEFRYDLVHRGGKLREIKVSRIIQKPLQAGGAAE